MTSLVVPVGALVEVHFGLSAGFTQQLLLRGLAVPPPIAVTALLDTGADTTTVELAVLNPFAAVGLTPSRFLYQNAPGLGGLTTVPEYEVSLTLGRQPGQPRSGWTVRKIPVLERSFGAGVAFRSILGRDVLDRLAFLYDGPGQRLTLLLGA